MKATLQFDLPEEQEEFRLANEGPEWHSLAWEIDQKLRHYLKYGHDFKSADEAIEEIRKFLYEEMDFMNVKL